MNGGAIAMGAARLALLALRGSIHPIRRLAPDSYAILPRREVLRTADATIAMLVATPKPLVCGAYASRGAVVIRCGPPREGPLERLAYFAAADRLDWHTRHAETTFAATAREIVARCACGGDILCAARDERLMASPEVIAEWERDYAIVCGSRSMGGVDDPASDSWPLYREARARSAAGVLSLNRLTSVTD